MMEIHIELVYWFFQFQLLNRQSWHGGRDWKSLYIVDLLLQVLPICEISFGIALSHGKLGGHVMLYLWPAMLHITSSSFEIKFRRYRLRYQKESWGQWRWKR